MFKFITEGVNIYFRKAKWAYFVNLKLMLPRVTGGVCNSNETRPVSHLARHQRPARERHKIRIASRENVDNQGPRKFYTLARFSLLLNVDLNYFISKYTDINSLHVTQIDLFHNNTFCST